jgi:hypothetical protein
MGDGVTPQTDALELLVPNYIKESDERIALQLTPRQWSWVACALIESDDLTWQGLGRTIQHLIWPDFDL